MRIPVQICCDHDGNLYVLANDATLWTQATSGWVKFDGLPQDGFEPVAQAPEPPLVQPTPGHGYQVPQTPRAQRQAEALPSTAPGGFGRDIPR